MWPAVAIGVPLTIALIVAPHSDRAFAIQAVSQPPAGESRAGTAASTTQQPASQQPAAQQSTPQQPAGSAGASRVTFGDANNVVRLSGPEADFLLTATGLGDVVDKLAGDRLDKYAATLAIADGGRVSGPSTHTLAIGPGRFVGRSGPSGLSWLVKVRADRLPADSSERRLLTFALGTGDTRARYALEYTLTNLPAVAPQYELTAPGHDWMVSWSASNQDRAYPLLVTNKSEPLPDLKIVQVSMKRTDDGDSIGFGRFQLLAAPDGQPGRIDLKPNEARTVFLRMDPSTRIGPFGTFTGQIQLGSQGTPPKPVALTAKVTSNGVKVAGVLLVVLGLSISLVTTNRLQPRLLRLQALRPALLLRGLLQQLSQRATVLAGADVAGIAAEADRQAARLEPDALDAAGLLPLALNVSGGLPADSASQLQALLNEISGRLAGLMVLRDGVVQLGQRVPAGERPASVSSAIASLNRFAPQASTADAAHAEVARVLDALETDEGLEGLQGFQPRAAPTPVAIQQLDFELEQTVNLAGVIWAAVSLAIGLTYVYSDVDFGTWYDLLGTFLWGLGLTTFGAGLQQLTPKTVATQIGLNVPKTGTTP